MEDMDHDIEGLLFYAESENPKPAWAFVKLLANSLAKTRKELKETQERLDQLWDAVTGYDP